MVRKYYWSEYSKKVLHFRLNELDTEILGGRYDHEK